MSFNHPRFNETLVSLQNTRFDYNATSISSCEGEFIWNLIRNHGYEKTIEIGCALGVSSLYICDALSLTGNPSHTIIDPFQTGDSDWEGIGIRNLKERNIDFFTLVEQPSEFALPKLIESGETFDFGFIDGYHTFDHALIDFFYLNRMIRVGGMIVFDDANCPSISKLIRYLRTYPAYQLVLPPPADNNQDHLSNRQKVLHLFIKATKLVPEQTRKELFSDRVNLGIIQVPATDSVVGLMKIGEDERRWDWYENFV
ncbi:MAG: class I SAM-dependent methyltransferase [Myxococcales bacterium]|nr:class I SAM-dependent methyltransferase [Myxococcales bacterium]